MVVLFRHAFNAIDMPIARQHEFLASPLAIVLNAQGAVQLFFVLSGFVLSASLARNHAMTDHLKFVLRRVCRIHPPYVFAALVALVASSFYGELSAGSGVSRWLSHFLGIRVGVSEFMGYLLFPGTAGGLLDVGWTLRIELVASFLLPFMMIAAQRTHWSVLVLFCLPLGLDASWRMLWYLFDFALGMVVFFERERLVALASRFSRPAAVVFFLVSLSLFVTPMFSRSPAVLMGRLVPGFQPAEIVSMGFGSAGLIVASMSFAELGKFLCRRPIAFLGRVSFSLYLLHKTILHLLVPVFAPYDGAVPIVLLYVTLISASLVAAAIAYSVVEKPSIRLGRRVSQGLARRLDRGSGGSYST